MRSNSWLILYTERTKQRSTATGEYRAKMFSQSETMADVSSFFKDYGKKNCHDFRSRGSLFFL